MDRDHSGQIDNHELTIAMKALGFGPDDIRDAILEGDFDGDGQLDFDEFTTLIMQAEAKPGANNHSADSFPFALVADSYRISRIVDSYNPKLFSTLHAHKGRLPALRVPPPSKSPRPTARPAETDKGGGGNDGRGRSPVRQGSTRQVSPWERWKNEKSNATQVGMAGRAATAPYSPRSGRPPPSTAPSEFGQRRGELRRRGGSPPSSSHGSPRRREAPL